MRFARSVSVGFIAGLCVLGVAQGAPAPAPAPVGPVDKSFQARRVHIDDLVARVEIVTAPQGPIRVQANGKQESLKEFQVRAVGDEVLIRSSSHDKEAWFPWSMFNNWNRDRRAHDLNVRIFAPLGTPFDIEDMIGSINAGDLNAPLRLEGAAIDARFGRVQSARLSLVGSGRVQVGPVSETLDAEIAGSGRIDVASAKAAQVEIAGSGDVAIGPLTGGLSIEIAGSGDVRVANVNGPVRIESAGSGDVAIDGGRANPFEIEIAGSGDVLFRGHAVDPNIEIFGSGDIRVQSYSGRLREEKHGSGRFTVMGQPVQPASPPPPGASAPPAPPAPPQPPQ
jgi:hypothetical protein